MSLWKNDQLMVIAAFRYCLGRRSYIVHNCAEWLVEYWSEFNDPTKKLIEKELEEYAKSDLKDLDTWQEVRKLYFKE